MTDEELLEVYMNGFTDELDSKEDIKFYLGDHPLKSKAYKLGRLDARLGDDNPNLDYRSGEEIIKMIRNEIPTIPKSI